MAKYCTIYDKQGKCRWYNDCKQACLTCSYAVEVEEEEITGADCSWCKHRNSDECRDCIKWSNFEYQDE